MIKVLGLNVIYKTFDFIIPLGVRILNTLEQTCFWIRIDINFFLKKLTKQNKIQLFQKQLPNKFPKFCFWKMCFSFQITKHVFHLENRNFFFFNNLFFPWKQESENSYQTWPKMLMSYERWSTILSNGVHPYSGMVCHCQK